MLDIINNKGGDANELIIVARGLSRIITDDYDFMDSDIYMEVSEIFHEIQKM
jgi:hypothetical protein